MGPLGAPLAGPHPQLERPLSSTPKGNPKKRTEAELDDLSTPNTKRRSGRPVKIFGLAELQSDVSERSTVSSTLGTPNSQRRRMMGRRDVIRTKQEGSHSGRKAAEGQGGLLAAEFGTTNSAKRAKSKRFEVPLQDIDGSNFTAHPSNRRGQSVFNLPSDDESLASQSAIKGGSNGQSVDTQESGTKSAEGPGGGATGPLPGQKTDTSSDYVRRSPVEDGTQYGTEEDTSDTQEIPLQKPPPNMVLLTYGPDPPVVASQPGFVVKSRRPQLGLPSPEVTPRTTVEPVSTDFQKQDGILDMPLAQSVYEQTLDTKESEVQTLDHGDSGQPDSEVDRAEPTPRCPWRGKLVHIC